MPTILFGRVGIIEETWLILSELGLECPVFDIDFFDNERAERFVLATLDRLAKENRYEGLARRLRDHQSVYQQASASFLNGLRGATESDGTHFAGYAPVLEAVATVLAGVPNPANLNDTVQETMRGRVLQQLIDQILKREATKIQGQLPEGMSEAVRAKLYTPTEQLTRLAGEILGTPAPAPPPELQAEYLSAYDAAVRGFMPQHPFLNGTGHQPQPSGVVFAAVINAFALVSGNQATVAAAEKRAGDGPHTPNPFLIDFYLDYAKLKSGHDFVVAPEHVVILYDSIRARISGRHRPFDYRGRRGERGGNC